VAEFVEALRYKQEGRVFDSRFFHVKERIIFRRILKWNVGVWTGLRWLRIETVGGHL
jgi:hypothetical protein